MILWKSIILSQACYAQCDLSTMIQFVFCLFIFPIKSAQSTRSNSWIGYFLCVFQSLLFKHTWILIALKKKKTDLHNQVCDHFTKFKMQKLNQFPVLHFDRIILNWHIIYSIWFRYGTFLHQHFILFVTKIYDHLIFQVNNQ